MCASSPSVKPNEIIKFMMSAERATESPREKVPVNRNKKNGENRSAAEKFMELSISPAS